MLNISSHLIPTSSNRPRRKQLCRETTPGRPISNGYLEWWNAFHIPPGRHLQDSGRDLLKHIWRTPVPSRISNNSWIYVLWEFIEKCNSNTLQWCYALSRFFQVRRRATDPDLWLNLETESEAKSINGNATSPNLWKNSGEYNCWFLSSSQTGQAVVYLLQQMPQLYAMAWTLQPLCMMKSRCGNIFWHALQKEILIHSLWFIRIDQNQQYPHK